MTKEQIVEKIQRLRKEKGYSMYRLSCLAGIAYNNYYRIENIKPDISVKTLQKICEALGISMKDFFDEEDIPEHKKEYIVSYLAPNGRTITRRVCEDDIETIIKYIQSTGCEIISISEISEDIKELLKK